MPGKNQGQQIPIDDKTRKLMLSMAVPASEKASMYYGGESGSVASDADAISWNRTGREVETALTNIENRLSALEADQPVKSSWLYTVSKGQLFAPDIGGKS